ncbi:cell envelope integrity protein TolA [Labrys sp. LIt4]|uniref:cell envelope integrity protein TolA n=1 Tax=Labrys sp. LIt4 TaxID=2821355 RepID=UPI001AE0BE27|nr:cell envelope integrity protein TolA [Labrys sp. LIt4]MBP0578999.1 cell envelope integrity protein TolA [Labrys sp. LIt4]
MKTFLAAGLALLVVSGASAQESRQASPKLTLAQQMKLQTIINRQVQPCLNMRGEKSFAKVRIQMNRDGSLAGLPVSVSGSDYEAMNALVRAVALCITPEHPLRFDPALYEHWRTFSYTARGGDPE